MATSTRSTSGSASRRIVDAPARRRDAARPRPGGPAWRARAASGSQPQQGGRVQGGPPRSALGRPCR
eukprot:9305000-Pyramimonas_sp.AAC.1